MFSAAHRCRIALTASTGYTYPMMSKRRSPVPASVNIIRNPRFSEGRTGPSRWVFDATDFTASWSREASEPGAAPDGMTVECHHREATALWSQVVVCAPGEHYRVEAVVTGDLDAADEAAGLVLAVEPTGGGQPEGERKVTPALHRASRPTTIRATYQVPESVRRLKISVGLVEARGTARIHEVRVCKVLEPDEVSHVQAIPAPPNVLDAPRIADRVCVCSKNAGDRPITRLLAGYFGDRQVQTLLPEELRPSAVAADALLLPDPTPPPAIRSLNGLVKLAADRVVVMSLPAFARLNSGWLSLKRIQQEDDPTFAKVAYANYATRGFALHDTFVYGWPGRTPGSFVQNQYRKTKALDTFCKRHGLKTLLVSMCDRDATSDRAISLFKLTPGGGLFVLDIEPAEAEGSANGEPTLAMHLLLSILGRPQTSLGQFIVPFRARNQFPATMREMAGRFEHFVVHDADVPAEEVTRQLVTAGREDQSYGLPLQPKPVILVRSGLSGGDVEGVYGALLWFKQLVQMAPHTCPYAPQLARQFRFAWVPWVAEWEARCGWRRSSRPPTDSTAIESENAEVAALVDIVSRPVNRVRVVVPQLDAGYRRYATWLPELFEVFAPGHYFAPTPPEGAGYCDRDSFAWRHIHHSVQVVADPAEFAEDAPCDVMAGGGEVARIEVPGHDADFTAHSIQRTDLAATLLEHVIGLQFGLIAVNRQAAPVQLDGFPPTAPGQALIVDRRDPMLQANASQAG